jgi:hypothetical protein
MRFIIQAYFRKIRSYIFEKSFGGFQPLKHQGVSIIELRSSNLYRMQLHVTELYMSQLNMNIGAPDGVNGALSQGGVQPGCLPEVLHNGSTKYECPTSLA